jgi:hypothetical protein
MRLRELFDFINSSRLPVLEGIAITPNGADCEILQEGQWVPGRFANNIRIDQPTHGPGQVHAHVQDRNRRRTVVIVNFDGTGSHGTKGKLHDRDADALRARGFNIRPDNIVEWIETPMPNILFG